MTKTIVTAKEVFDELDANMADLRAEGLVDMSAPFIVNKDGVEQSTPVEVAIVLNNVLRMRREGGLKPTIIA